MSDTVPSSVDMCPPRKRRRPPKACEPCRRRKVGCDLGLPCGPCKRARGSIKCTYRVDARNRRNSATVNESDTAELSLAARSHSPASQANIPIHEDLGTIECGAVGSGTTTEYRPQDRQRHPADSGGVRRRSFEPGLETSPTLRLRNTAEKSRLFGKSHWFYTAETLPAVTGGYNYREVDFSWETEDMPPEVFKEARKLRHVIKSRAKRRGSVVDPDLLSSLPPKLICDKLISHYMRTLQPIYRIVHMPSFQTDYDRFWEQPDTSKASSRLVMKLALMLAIGATFYTGPDAQDLQTKVPGWIQAAQAWLTGPSEKSTMNLDGLQVFCLLLVARQTTPLCPGMAWVSAGPLLTAAMSMGLHRNPDHFPLLTALDAEMRKRLWAATVELTIQSHVDAALPLLLSPQDFDTPYPANVNDEDLLPRTGAKARPAPRQGVTDSSLQIQLCKSQRLRLEVGRALNGLHAQPSYDRVISLGSQLRDASRSSSAFFRSVSAAAATKPPSFTDFHRKFLDVTLHRYMLLLQRPFMIRSRSDPHFYLSRKLCVESATLIASYAEHGASDDFFLLAAVGRGSFKGPLGLDVILVLGLEIFLQLEESGAGPPDRLDELHRSARAALTASLEAIAAGRLEAIRRGNVSMKSYGFLLSLLARVRAMEDGRPVQELHGSFMEAIKFCLSALREHPFAQQGADAGQAPEDVDMSPFTLDSLDILTNWDISNFLYLPEMEGL